MKSIFPYKILGEHIFATNTHAQKRKRKHKRKYTTKISVEIKNCIHYAFIFLTTRDLVACFRIL